MGMDAVAVLKIPGLEAPQSEYGTTYHVEHRGDCTLLHTMVGFRGPWPDELAMIVRAILGDALDAHDDARGLLFFPDVLEPRGASYDAIVHEIGDGGVWGPKVPAGHVPDRITKAEPGSFEALLRRALEQHGDRGRQQLEALEILGHAVRSPGCPPERQAEYREQRATIAALMGEAFTAELERVLDARYAAFVAQQEAEQAHWAPMLDRVSRGEPLFSSEQVGALLSDPETAPMLEALVPGLKDELAGLLGSLGVDVDALPDDDVGKLLAKSFGLAPASKAKKTTPRKATAKKKPAKKKPAGKRPQKKAPRLKQPRRRSRD